LDSCELAADPTADKSEKKREKNITLGGIPLKERETDVISNETLV
jgi:hypothetical protein